MGVQIFRRFGFAPADFEEGGLFYPRFSQILFISEFCVSFLDLSVVRFSHFSEKVEKIILKK